MLNHHHGVALVTQLLQRCDELSVIPLMQSYGRLVQNIKHIHQLRAYLGRQSDPLAFSA